MKYQIELNGLLRTVEVIGETDSFYKFREVKENGTISEFRKKKPVTLLELPKESSNAHYDYWITKPFQHQIDFLKYSESNECVLLRDDPGLGKTKQSLDLIMNRKRTGQINRALIVCCVGGLQYNWLREVKKHTDLRGYILGTRPANKLGTATRIGSNKDKLNDLKMAKADILICNVEMLRDTACLIQLQLMIAKGDLGMIVVDEVHKCKNTKAQQTAGLFSLHPRYKLGLTGTPIINSPMDLYGISCWLGHELRSFSKYRDSYCIMGGFKNKQIVGYHNLQDLTARLDMWSLRRRKEDCLDLPEKTVIYSQVEMTNSQKSLYKDVLKDIRDRPEDILALPTPMGRFVGLRKVTSCPSVVSENWDGEDCAKFQETLRLVEEALQNNQKVVIYTWYVFTLQYLNIQLRKHGIIPAVIYGEMSLEARNANEQAFQTNPDCKVILGNYQTMGTGIELTAASLVIEYELPWTYADEKQGQDRCHRIGQNKNITCIRLVSKDTIDERVVEVVDMKEDLEEQVNNRKSMEEIVRKSLISPF